jgi:hypothetical protein
MTVVERHQPARHRTIFLSDIHLGTRGCQAELLLDFLKKNECENLYLVGDIVDGWRLKRWWYWPQAHNDVVQNCQLTFGDVRVEEEAIHEMADGRRLLIAQAPRGAERRVLARGAKLPARVGSLQAR